MHLMKFTGSYCLIAGLKNKTLTRTSKKPEIRSMGIAEMLTENVEILDMVESWPELQTGVIQIQSLAGIRWE